MDPSSPARTPRRVSIADSIASPSASIRSPKSPKVKSIRSRKTSLATNMDTIAMQQQDPPLPKITKIRPSKIPATPGTLLHEVTDTDANARAMPPPSLPVPKKSALPAKPKRKTLAERAGEYNPPEQLAPPPMRSGSASLKTSQLGGPRSVSVSSSGSSTRVPSISSRITSGSSTSSYNGAVPASKISTGIKRTASQSIRPSKTIQHSMTIPEEGSVLGKRKCMTPIVHNSSDGPVLLQKTRKRSDSTIYLSSENASSSRNPLRNISITNAMQQLSLTGGPQRALPIATAAGPSDAKCPDTPSYIPKIVPQTPVQPSRPATPIKELRTSSPKKSSFKIPFLSRYTNTQVAWDTEGRSKDVDRQMYKDIQELKAMQADFADKETRTEKRLATALKERESMQDEYKVKIFELEMLKSTLSITNKGLQTELDDAKARLSSMMVDFDNLRRSSALEMDDLRRKHRNEFEDMRDDMRRNEERIRREAQTETDRLIKVHLDELEELDRRRRNEIEEEKNKRAQEMQEVSSQLALYRQTAELETGTKQRELQAVKAELEQAREDIEKNRAMNESLRTNLAESQTHSSGLETSLNAMKGKIGFLESNSQSQSEAYAEMDRRMQEALASAEESKTKLRQEETLRRKLHNQVQELKGNIRVFCRVRPSLPTEADEAAKLNFPDQEADSKELLVTGPDQKSSLGTVTAAKHAFSFDRVFSPTSQNLEVFDEISQLVQSALDGYNVCIFCYGQTGSGKTYTMSSADGMIPLAVHQIYDTAKNLEDKGWTYTMEGSFVEVYNENLNDLLGKAEELDKKKLEIRHDNAGGKTNIVGVETMMLDSPDMLKSLLQRADGNRSVAATKANQRSSRSHSVFILKLLGVNSMTGERSEGTLNLVDLAGSERIGHSQVTGERLKETQSINKSLSCLGDVIAALGQGKDGGHVPYRNSKLTYLLQHSLGGNSKTLMFVMISPLQAHLSETLTSLKFATKVHNTHIGTAKRQARVSG